MSEYNSKYTGEDIENKLDALNITAVDAGEMVEETVMPFATIDYVDEAIANAITLKLNTEV